MAPGAPMARPSVPGCSESQAKKGWLRSRSSASGSKMRTRGPEVSASAVGAVTISVPVTAIANSASWVSPERKDHARIAFHA